jgi:hypothetical protein
MTLKIVLGLLVMSLFTTTLLAQEDQAFYPEEKFSADSLRTWTTELMDGLSETHPGFYRYTPKKKFDSIIKTTLSSFTDSLNTIDYYRTIKPLFAQIGCLHTSITLSDQFEEYIDKIYKLFPFEVYITENNQVFITKNHSINKSIRLESELLSINGKPIKDILEMLMKSIPSDGYNTTLKTLLLNHRFAFWYRSMIDLSENFKIATRFNNNVETFNLNGITSAEFESIDSLQSVNSEPLDFKINDSKGVLTIKSFAKTDIGNNGQNFKRYIKSVFKTLNEEKIENLIIDLRYNTGGTDGNAAFLASHFFDESFRYWDKIEVTKEIAGQIKGNYRIFYKKPVKVDSTYHWIGARWWLTKEFDYYKVQKPAKNNYKGKTYIITNGLCMSSCSDFVAIISDNQKTKIIGQESGGGFQGNTSGMMPTNSFAKNMTITIPLQKYTNAVDLKKNKGRGTIPDYIVQPTLTDWIDKKDIEMNFVNKLIKK